MDKVLKLSKMLGTTPAYIMEGNDDAELNNEDENVDINEVLDSLLRSLDNGTGLYPSGKAPQTVAEKVALANSIKLVMETVDSMDK